jgi:hypothetical protein
MLSVAAQRAPEQQYWIIQPLLDAGLGLDEIRTLVFDLGFQAIVSADGGTVADVLEVVRDRPVAVRLAWQAMIGRMLDLDEPAGSPASGAEA